MDDDEEGEEGVEGEGIFSGFHHTISLLAMH